MSAPIANTTEREPLLITKELLRPWSPCAEGYRWFLDKKFPGDQASYQVVMQALRADDRHDDARWLTDKVWELVLNTPATVADVTADHKAEALALMEANLSEPLPTEEVARLVGVSRRQLERLFKQHLDSLPSRHYLALRLDRAQRLLQQGTQSILQVGLSCGFASGPHFSNAYKAHHGHTPREERSRRPGWLAPAPQGDLS